ncbi:hypothetical protein [Candidatus Nitrospira bockiana]
MPSHTPSSSIGVGLIPLLALITTACSVPVIPPTAAQSRSADEQALLETAIHERDEALAQVSAAILRYCRLQGDSIRDREECRIRRWMDVQRQASVDTAEPGGSRAEPTSRLRCEAQGRQTLCSRVPPDLLQIELSRLYRRQ